MDERGGVEQRSHKVVLAGVGGSGVVWNGTLIARAGLRGYPHVSRLPNFTTSMRGGPCECMVVLSTSPIVTPLVLRGDALLILDSSQLGPFEERVSPGGLIVLESSGGGGVRRDDVGVLRVPAVELASEMGNPLVSSMIILGAYVQATGVFPPQLIEEEIEARLGSAAADGGAGSRSTLLSDNRDAFRRGIALARDTRA